jgi:hypothetical protein
VVDSTRLDSTHRRIVHPPPLPRTLDDEVINIIIILRVGSLLLDSLLLFLGDLGFALALVSGGCSASAWVRERAAIVIRRQKASRMRRVFQDRLGEPCDGS